MAAASNDEVVVRDWLWLETDAEVTAEVTAASDAEDDPAKLLRLCEAKLQ